MITNGRHSNDFDEGRYLTPKPTVDSFDKLSIEKRVAAAIDVFESRGIHLSGRKLAILIENVSNSSLGINNFERVFSDVPPMGSFDTENVDDSWFSAFVDGAKRAFSNWESRAYGKVFHEETLSPGSVSMVTLTNMAKMGCRDIENFVQVCSLSYVDENDRYVRPLIFFLDDNKLSRFDLSSRDLRILEEIGLISIRNMQKHIAKEDTEIALQRISPGVNVENRMVIFKTKSGQIILQRQYDWFETKKRLSVNYGIVDFTESGKELANAFGMATHQELRPYIVECYRRIERMAINEEKRRANGGKKQIRGGRNNTNRNRAQ